MHWLVKQELSIYSAIACWVLVFVCTMQERYIGCVVFGVGTAICLLLFLSFEETYTRSDYIAELREDGFSEERIREICKETYGR